MYNGWMLILVFRLVSFVVFVVLACTLVTNAQTKKKAKTKSPNSVKNIVVSGDKSRIDIERQILAGEYNHDDIGALVRVGTIESVPALLKVLDHFKISSDGTMICIRGHALTALSRITGQNFGSTYEAWSTWWETNKENLLQKKK